MATHSPPPSPEGTNRAGFEAVWINESAAQFHHREFAEAHRAVWIPDLSTETTLVLGSRQDAATADPEALRANNTSLTIRRSGGGAVLVSQLDLTWFDILISAEDPLWTNDVIASFGFVARAVQSGLSQIGIDGLVQHDGPLIRTDWSDLVCFAGLGPGELTQAGRKLVGISQRRTRDTARFQIAVLKQWRPKELLGLIALEPSQRSAAQAAIESSAVGVEHDSVQLIDGVIQALDAGIT